MTKDKALTLALEAGFTPSEDHEAYIEMLEHFAELVRADEREACAKVCEAFGEIGLGVNSAAAAIRARGNT